MKNQNRRIGDPPFQLGDIGPIHLCLQSQGLLSQPKPPTRLFDLVGKFSAKVIKGFGHQQTVPVVRLSIHGI